MGLAPTTSTTMMMALGGLFDRNLIKWITSMTYQAASGAGAKNMRELVAQMAAIGQVAGDILNTPESAIADLDRRNIPWKKFYNINFPPRRRENRDENGLFTAANWPARPSGLLGPVLLIPVEFKKN